MIKFGGMKGFYIEDCLCITPNHKSVDYDLMQKMGVCIEYHIEENHVIVTVGNNEPQRIDTENMTTAVAWRTLFCCPCCDEKVHKLYLLPDGKEFKCRKCYPDLKYFLTAINKESPHGKMLYAMNRMDKLSKKREKMGTILYKGEKTKWFNGFLRQCKRAGFTKIVDDAEILMGDLKNFEIRQNLYKA